MAAIKGKSGVLWEIDPLSNAGRVTLYDKSGNEINPLPTGVYMLPINLGRLTAALASGDCIWTMRNTDTAKSVYIKEISLFSGFDGTPAATSALYNICRIATATPTGGTAMTVIKTNNTSGTGAFPTSVITDARYNAGAALSVTNVTFETAMMAMSCPRQNSASNNFEFNNNGHKEDIVLRPGEGLAIRLGVAAVVGDVISGFVKWTER